MVLLRVFGVLFIFLSIVYVCVTFYSRAVRRDKLRAAWEEEGRQGDRDAYVREGLADYEQSFRRKLILSIYIVPMIIVGAIIYFVNYA